MLKIVDATDITIDGDYVPEVAVAVEDRAFWTKLLLFYMKHLF